ncbi:hypothetical protein [Glutamicibacter soli]
MSLSVILDGTELNDPNSRFGYLEVDDIDGWFNAPAAKQKQSARENADGDYPAPTYYESRFITISGALAAAAAESRWTWTDYLNGLLNRGKKQLAIRIDGQTQWAMVERTAQPEIDVVANRLIEYQIQLKATDPYKYGAAYSPQNPVGEPMDVHQYGNTPAWPEATVTGSFPEGYELTLNGQLVQVTRPLASGKTHTLNMRTGILRENGTRIYGGIGIAEYLTIKPGAKQNFYAVASSGTGNVKLGYRDTYI